MYQIGETVWAIINMFDIPKKVKIKGIEYGNNVSANVTIKYRVQYKMKEFIIMTYKQKLFLYNINITKFIRIT